ncbi:TrkH family potassium uptake protein [Sneathiella sp.]|uniref:TrkH family potassium uptake protein n=1 Tax=Sneathiella sp. TaxID=1964365 RepID=UPI002FE3938D
MQLAHVFTIVGWGISLHALLMLAPMAFSLLSGEGALAFDFFVAGLVTLFVGGGMLLAMRQEFTTLGRRETFFAATLIWIMVPAFAALPFYLSGAIPSATNAYFEALSGFSTNGATILADVAAAPRPILFWRSLLQWSGGFSVLVFLSMLAGVLNLPGTTPLTRALAKVSARPVTQRLGHAVLSLLKIYALLTAACIAALLVAGTGLFDAVCYAFSVLSTGGFLTSSGADAFLSDRIVEAVLMVFMTIAAINFSFHWSFFNGDRRSYFKDPEYRYLLAMIVFASLLVFLLMLPHSDLPALETLRYAIFNTVSAVTTTGINMPVITGEGVYYWPVGALLLLLLLMIVGGATVSTAGGIKLMRLSILARLAGQEISRLSYPSSVAVIKYGGERVERQQILSAWSVFVLYCLSLVAVTLLLTADGLQMPTALILATTNLATAGSAATTFLADGLTGGGGFHGYDALPRFSKWILCITMLIGRLEILAVLSLLNPAIWRR